MKTMELWFFWVQWFVPGALGVGNALPDFGCSLAPVELSCIVQDSSYVWMVTAFRHARCAEVKRVPLALVGDTLVVDVLGAYYSSAVMYPYVLLYEAVDAKQGVTPGTMQSIAPAALADRGFTDAQEIRIPVSEAGRYYLLINDVNRSVLEFVVDTVTSQSIAPAVSAVLRVGCVVYE